MPEKESLLTNKTMDRPKRNINKPKDIYVPDPNQRMEDDSDVESDFDIDEEDVEDLDISSEDEESGEDEYDFDDDFLVPGRRLIGRRGVAS